MYRFERWRAAIQAAPTKAAVQKVIRDYLDAIMPSDLGRMPPECHLPLSKGDEDVEGAAVELVRAELCFAGDAETAAVLHEIVHTFVAASHRIASIETPMPPGG